MAGAQRPGVGSLTDRRQSDAFPRPAGFARVGCRPQTAEQVTTLPRAPQVLYRAYPPARAAVAASGGFKGFCAAYPAHVELVRPEGGGRNWVRLVQARSPAA